MLTKSPLNPRRSWIALAVALLSLSARSEALAAGAAVGTHVARALSVLQQGFESPPQSARPQVWWHWIGGNITRAGIRKDLEWMHRIGIGGVDQIQLSFFTPQIVKYPLAYLSPGWKAAFRDAADLTAQHGMQLSIDSSPGWSETGGPWVRPDEAMKKLVWTATVVVGGAKLRGMLPPPPANTGPLQDAPMSGGIMGPPKFSGLRFYRDALVVAYRAPVLDPRPVSATSSSGPIAALALTQLTDGRLTDGPSVSPRDGKGWIELRFPKPERLQGATIAPAVSSGGSVAVTLYASLDGASWSKVALMQPGGVVVAAGFPQTTVSFAPIVARYVRVDLRALPQLPLQGASAVNAPGTIPVMAGLAAFMGHAAKPPTFRFHELVLHSRATVNEFEAKAYFRIVPDYYAVASVAPVVPGTVVHADDVVNLTGRMKPDGTLDWMPPPGRWVVLRMGYSLEGTTNHPVSPAATGLEVDKLSRRAVDSYMEHYIALYDSITGPAAPGIDAITTDSTEVGMQNWTPDLLADFRRLRGYDPTPWLPALTGVVVGSPAQSDKFLWDFRHTINELLARNHYGEIARIAHSHGLEVYGEALEDHRPTFGDDMEMRQYTDIPMGAMWMYPPGGKSFPTYVADLEGAASVAHIYGQNLVGAESLDSVDEPWAYAPRELKPVIDREFTLGVNRVMIHASAHQPLDKPPGLTLSLIGQMFDRLDTWANDAGPWMTYIARCSYLLQQGHHAADIAYFYGQEAPVTGLFGDRPVDVPDGYGFDFVDSDALLHALAVQDGGLVTPSGTRYRILYLGGSSRWMTLSVLRRIDDLVRQGATVVGSRPLGSPSLGDDAAQFEPLARDLFGAPGSGAMRRVGKGAVFLAGSLPQALQALGLQPDFAYTRSASDADLRYIHRHLADGDLYFVSNRRDRSERTTASFRVAGRAPELWNAVTGAVEPVSYQSVGGRTDVPLRLAPYGSVFVVFLRPAASPSRTVVPAQRRTLMTLDGPWHVAFQPGRGAPAEIVMRHLASWTTSPIAGVRYFSGTATYTRSFRLSERRGAARWLLDLGEAPELAKVTVNGKPVTVLWTPPFRVDITRYVHPGLNDLAIAVTNLWVNRLIGDQQPGVKRKYTFATIPTYEPNAPLRASGLLGPVRLEQISEPGGR